MHNTIINNIMIPPHAFDNIDNIDDFGSYTSDTEDISIPLNKDFRSYATHINKLRISMEDDDLYTNNLYSPRLPHLFHSFNEPIPFNTSNTSKNDIERMQIDMTKQQMNAYITICDKVFPMITNRYVHDSDDLLIIEAKYAAVMEHTKNIANDPSKKQTIRSGITTISNIITIGLIMSGKANARTPMYNFMSIIMSLLLYTMSTIMYGLIIIIDKINKNITNDENVDSSEIIRNKQANLQKFISGIFEGQTNFSTRSVSDITADMFLISLLINKKISTQTCTRFTKNIITCTIYVTSSIFITLIFSLNIINKINKLLISPTYQQIFACALLTYCAFYIFS